MARGADTNKSLATRHPFLPLIFYFVVTSKNLSLRQAQSYLQEYFCFQSQLVPDIPHHTNHLIQTNNPNNKRHYQDVFFQLLLAVPLLSSPISDIRPRIPNRKSRRPSSHGRRANGLATGGKKRRS